jgi:uncharacterized lipoprotein YmbA
MIPRIVLAILAFAAGVLPGACTTTSRASFYTLNGSQGESVERRSSLVLALGPIDLPQYLDRPQIVTRIGGNRLSVDEFNRWGGSLEQEVSRVLTQHLGRRLQTQRVYSYPSRIAADSDYRIALEIRRFDGELGGEVDLDLVWSLIADRTGEVVQTRQAEYRSATRDAGYEAYAAALSDTLAQLGDDLAGALSGLPAPASGR